MTTHAIRQVLHPDAQGQIHIEVPAVFGQAVEVIVRPLAKCGGEMTPGPQISLGDSALVREVIASPEEDCWNDL